MCEDVKTFAIQVTLDDGAKRILPGYFTSSREWAEARAVRMSFAASGNERYEVVEVEGC